jgi:1-acyl-sn-glycerol-3-phosphate acyltransferase
VGSLDPLFIQSTSPRLIRWMMAKEYFEIKAIRWVFAAVGVILVDRAGRDMAATRAAMRALEDGYILGVFPEGKFATTRELLQFQNGIGLLALKSGAPVYPAYIDGTQRGKGMVQAFVESNTCNLIYGPRVEFKEGGSPRHKIESATQQIQQAIMTLRQGLGLDKSHENED